MYLAPLDLDDAPLAQGERMGSPSLKFAHYSIPEVSGHSDLAALRGPVTDLAKTIQHTSGSVGNSSLGPMDVMQDSSNPMEVIKLKAKGITKVWGVGGTVETDWSKTKPYASSANTPPPPPPSLPAVANFTTTATGEQPSAHSFSEKKEAVLTTPKQKTPEELEKERMAAALFGGIGDAQTNGRGVTRSRQGQWGRRVGDASKISSTASGETGRSAAVSQDLLDMSFDMPGGGMEEKGIILNDESGACNSSSPPLHHDVQSMSHSIASNINVFEGMTVKSAVAGLSTSAESIHGVDDARCDASPPNLLGIEGIQSHGSVPEVECTITPKGSELGRSHDLSTTFSKNLMGSTKTATLPGGNGTEGHHRTTTTFSWGGHTMQPLLIDTHEFGEDWTGSDMTERTLVGLKCGQHPFKTPEDVMRVLAWHGLRPVESIASTSEGICAGTCRGTRLLAHFKLQPQCAAVDLTVHCQNDNISDAFLLHLKQNIPSNSMESNNNN